MPDTSPQEPSPAVGEGSTAATNGPLSVRSDGERVLEFFLPDRAFERFVAERWLGLQGPCREVARDAFCHGGWAFAEGLVALLELEPVNDVQRLLIQEIRSSMEAASRG